VKVTWDPAKDLENQRKHGISFKEAAEVFSSDVKYLEIFDEVHSEIEDRFITIGAIRRGVALVISTEQNEETIRLISARWATSSEQRLYHLYLEDYDE
jgi:uncharacterized DUF497 family protein